MIGRRVVRALSGQGHRVWRAVRRPSARPDEVAWTPDRGALATAVSFDAVVHLAGESLAAARWSPSVERRLWSSRVDATRALCERLSSSMPPRTLVCASAVGIYGDRGDELLDESSAPGRGFLAELAQAWEAACAPLARAGWRVVSPRFGLVLSRDGGALRSLLLPARLGLGGPLGGGRQFWSWIAIADLVAALRRAVDDPGLAGPINVVAPDSIRQRDFARELGQVLRRPSSWPTPAWLLRGLLGEMAEAMILSSARVVPRRLEVAGFTFQHPDLTSALRAALHGAG